MAKQSVGIGSSANDGQGDTLRTGATKINDNFNEIYAEFGDGTNLSSGNTAGDILIADGTKFVNRTTSGDISISNTGAINLRTQSATNGQELTIGAGSTPSSTSNKLYNVGGTLYWDGNTVGVASGGSFSSFTVSGDTGSDSVTDGNTLKIATGSGLTSTAADASGTPTVTINLDLTTGLTFEGATANAHETTLAVTDPTADRTITLPDATGTVALTSDLTSYITASSTTAFTNKTIDADATGNSITNIEDANIKTGANIAQSKLNLAVTTAEVAAGTLVVASEGIGSNNNDTTIPTSAAVKAYADSVGGGNSFTTIAVSGQNNVVADSGTDTLTLAAGSNVTITTNDSTDTVTIAASGGGSSTLSGLSDTSISSSASGQTLMYDGSNSYDNKQIKVFEDNAAFTAAFPLFFGAQMFTISAADTSYGYRFENYNSNGTNMDSGAGDAVGTLTVFEDQIMMFQLNQGGHAFAIRTGASGGNTGTNLTSSNGGNNLIHIATDGTVTSGTSANAKTSGTLIWKVPHFGSNQASTYYYQCTAHPASMYGLIKIRTITY